MSIKVSVAKVRVVGVSCFQDVIKNIYNVHTKIQCRDSPFKSETELPSYQITHLSKIPERIDEQLSYIFPEADDSSRKLFYNCGKNIIKETNGKNILDNLMKIYEEAWTVVRSWEAHDELFVGVIPKMQDRSYFRSSFDEISKKMYIHWDVDSLGGGFIDAVSRMLRNVRDERRQPTPCEYLATHLAYNSIQSAEGRSHEKIQTLGTPGFRPHTQTYMSLTDPGEGHVMGTTRFNKWMQGAIVHVEHLERPRHLSRKQIESYRVPSVLDFSRVRLHVGSSAPTTYFLGRPFRDSGNFEQDFLKIVHITAAAASAAFSMGAAECKIAMEGLTTSQAVRYMLALRSQTQRSRKQLLSAAWNLNQTVIDDYENDEDKSLTERIDIGLTAVKITSLGGFEKVTWDGASDTYPSKCIMYQLTFQEALTIVHEAHIKGLVTYFSAGFKFNEIQHAVFAGVDGIGIGGAQVLRYMDSETGMHGPYTEENIPTILQKRDEAAQSLRGRGVDLLVKLDTMFFEGSISRSHEYIRQKLFKALLAINEESIKEILEQMTSISDLEREGNEPFIHRAKRIIEADSPLLKDFCSVEEWNSLLNILKSGVVAHDEASLVDEYDSDPWLSIRHRYRQSQCPMDAKTCFVRQASLCMPIKC